MVDISVIIPTRNRPGPLRRALASVVRQTGAPPTECIVVDDGDSASSEPVARAAADHGAAYFATGGGRGGSFARNLGIEHARGALIAFLDDDDLWLETKLAEQAAFMSDLTIAMSYTAATNVDGRGRRRYTFRLPDGHDQHRAIMLKNFVGSTSTVMARRTALVEIGGFDPDLPALQDYDLCIRLLHRHRTGWIDKALTVYHTDDSAGDKVSGSRDRFIRARELLRRKYRDDPQYALLSRSLRSIELLKCVRSRRFLVDTLRAFIRRRP